MDIKSFSNERIKNMIFQSYNFDTEIIEDVIIEAKKRGLLSTFEIDKLINKNDIIKKKKKEKNYQLDKKMNMRNLEDTSNSFSKWFFIIMPFIATIAIAMIFLYIKVFHR